MTLCWLAMEPTPMCHFFYWVHLRSHGFMPCFDIWRDYCFSVCARFACVCIVDIVQVRFIELFQFSDSSLSPWCWCSRFSFFEWYGCPVGIMWTSGWRSCWRSTSAFFLPFCRIFLYRGCSANSFVSPPVRICRSAWYSEFSPRVLVQPYWLSH